MLVSKSSQQTLSWLVYRPLHVRPSVEVARPVFSVFLALTTKFISWGLRLDFGLRHSAIQFPLDQNDVENPLSVARDWKTTWSKTWQFDHERIEPPHNTKQSLRKHWLLVKHYWSEKKNATMYEISFDFTLLENLKLWSSIQFSEKFKIAELNFWARKKKKFWESFKC